MRGKDHHRGAAENNRHKMEGKLKDVASAAKKKGKREGKPPLPPPPPIPSLNGCRNCPNDFPLSQQPRAAAAGAAVSSSEGDRLWFPFSAKVL